MPWTLLDDDAAWKQPLIAENWPAGLRSSWIELVAHRNELLTLVESLPRARCHLDLWVCNAIRRPTGEIALLDWAFTGDGALGEDIGNHIPDAVFDLFWPAERIAELAETCADNYLEGLREGGWRGATRPGTLLHRHLDRRSPPYLELSPVRRPTATGRASGRRQRDEL